MTIEALSEVLIDALAERGLLTSADTLRDTMLSDDDGLVLQTRNGSRFIVTIHKV